MEFQNLKDFQTEKLALSIIKNDDVDIIYDLRSNAEVQKYISREPFTKMVQAESQMEKVLGLLHNQKAITWIIKLKSDSKKVGSICFWNFSSDRKTAELGYDLLPEFHNKGIMSEAMKAVLFFGFQSLQLRNVLAYTSKYNNGSIALLEKNDFELQENRVEKGYPDNIIFSLSVKK